VFEGAPTLKLVSGPDAGPHGPGDVVLVEVGAVVETEVVDVALDVVVEAGREVVVLAACLAPPWQPVVKTVSASRQTTGVEREGMGTMFASIREADVPTRRPPRGPVWARSAAGTITGPSLGGSHG
jgi:hypothetical protein